MRRHRARILKIHRRKKRPDSLSGENRLERQPPALRFNTFTPPLFRVICNWMSDFTEPTFAWEPLTPRGVAAFARAKFGRLLLVQFIVALLAAASLVWFFDDGCFLTIGAAIQKLPADGKIRSGKLDWHGGSPRLLAEGRFLAFDVDLNHSGQINSTADVQIEFGRESVRVFSSLGYGYTDFFYLPDRVAPFNRTELEPLWGAWAVEILFIAGAAAVIGLLMSWWLLATVYFLPVWLLGFFANRDLNFRASWKLSGAALIPGALLMAAGSGALHRRPSRSGCARIYFCGSFRAGLDLPVREPAFSAANSNRAAQGKSVRGQKIKFPAAPEKFQTAPAMPMPEMKN